MSAPKDGGSITPTMKLSDNGLMVSVGGLSKREWFAGMALQGLMVGYADHNMQYPCAVKLAFEVADAMLAARGGKENA